MGYSSNLPEQNQDQDSEVITDLENKIIIYNDDVNTFEWVIETLVEVCKHSREQAEQCAYIIHHRGKYAVKHGAIKTLKPMKDAITERGIQAIIE